MYIFKCKGFVYLVFLSFYDYDPYPCVQRNTLYLFTCYWDGLLCCVYKLSINIRLHYFICYVFYPFLYTVIPFKSSLMLTHQVDFNNRLSLLCSTKELPSSLAVWRRDRIILAPSETVTSHISVVNVSSVLYDSELIMEWSGSGVSLLNCLVHSEWLMPGDSFYTAECKLNHASFQLVYTRPLI